MREVLSEAGSTNAILLERAGRGERAREGDWLIADRQTAGRGRAGRVWSDGAGNFMGSTIAKLAEGDPPAQTLALVAGVAVHQAVDRVCTSGPDLFLKWPNDILIAGAKCGGILLERSGDTVVVGIGVNLVFAPEIAGRATASLSDHGCTASRDEFAAILETCWAEALARWHGGGWAELRQDWLERAHVQGTLLSVNDREHGLITGAFAGLGDDGTLHLRLADGARRAIHAGDVEMVS
ncbi:biotin--[acetyl-CoA-carboxylase] ligase [Novosphingobium tardum]|uniref:biotin--[biotin carboxyl-carrier protein] ligase n=1 Tax=Novosphingobium tardum TaxID=1538021 RepID=A0ABV8RRN6_9SPHN